ncbi:hypothetical protein AOLI_G00090560 [Acnodon oligacanthus]
MASVESPEVKLVRTPGLVEGGAMCVACKPRESRRGKDGISRSGKPREEYGLRRKRVIENDLVPVHSLSCLI